MRIVSSHSIAASSWTRSTHSDFGLIPAASPSVFQADSAESTRASFLNAHSVLAGGAAQRMVLAKNTGSILDSVAQEARLAETLGPADRTKLNEYLDSVREIEQRIDRGKACTKP